MKGGQKTISGNEKTFVSYFQTFYGCLFGVCGAAIRVVLGEWTQ